MAKYFDEKINRNTDWGGDESTGNLKVKGSRVQEFGFKGGSIPS